MIPRGAGDSDVEALQQTLEEPAARTDFYRCDIAAHWRWKVVNRDGPSTFVDRDAEDYRASS